jgi:DNA-directed RNA polymerase I subunit RPA1
MNISVPISSEISSVSFSFYSPQELKRMSVLKIHETQIFDALDHPVKGGLYDPQMGPNDKHEM